MISDAQAIEASRLALRSSFPGEPSTGEVVALDAVALLETSRGEGWKGAGAGSFNMGAIQCGAGWTGDRFWYVDTHPNADGTSTPYRIDFRKYKTRLAGMIDLVRVAYVNRGRSRVRDAARAQDWMGVSRALHDTGYYEGFGKTTADRILNHNRALMKGVNRDLAAMNLAAAPVALPPSNMPRTLRRGDGPQNGKGFDVAELQRHFGIAADGIFGACTEIAVKAFQEVNGLKPDGIVGPITWAELRKAA